MYGVTKLTFEGIVISENQQQSTKKIQLLDKYGQLSNNVVVITTDCIKSKEKVKATKISINNTILNVWLRKSKIDIVHNKIDENILEMMLEFSKYELRVRLTRPVSLGHANNSHHLHIRQIEVYSVSNPKYCVGLSFFDGSPCIKRGSAGRTPWLCIDGNKGLQSYNVNHNDYTNIHESNSQTHWMEFLIDENQTWIKDSNDVGKIIIYNRGDGFKDRIVGCILDLYKDDKIIKSWTVRTIQDIYQFYNDDNDNNIQ